MGFDFKIGYQLPISNRETIDLGPIVNFTNLILFDRNKGDYYLVNNWQVFTYYVGLDIALYFGLKKS